MTRRNFFEKSLMIGAGSFIAPSLLQLQTVEAAQGPRWIGKNDISLAQWSLVDEINAGKWKTLDFPKIARQDFGLNGIEFVNTLFEVPTFTYLNQLKKNAEDNGVEMVLIMIDLEGETCTPSKEERKQTVINHRKWIDIANYLGCHAIRTNCRGADGISKTEALKWSAETYNMMLDYAIPANISILIENHGGVSDDADWLVSLMKEVNNKYLGILPDWRQPGGEIDNMEYLRKTLPYAGGMSFRNQPTDKLNEQMIKMTYKTGFRGWYGVESNGRENIHKSIELLNKYLLK
ncbi:sugar phosphate isomerase/epimerase family protein [Proteiniphilum sp. UBA5384]|uniref:sugar phosphate isomerase/epimerase family protein n=1 Tax=Proteiniphilum sp. UBA5384 TaxID=1947279 RepID=UPI0025D5219B|nr:TIM barrel protein [Proteiniphilum sp. UBA5384]